MRRLDVHAPTAGGYRRRMAADDAVCAQHVWVLAVIGEGRGRLDIASTCSVCGALNDEAGPATPGDALPSW
jgi:hypothetical protein